MLPNIDVIDGLINFYFEYCNWIYISTNPPLLSIGSASKMALLQIESLLPQLVP